MYILTMSKYTMLKRKALKKEELFLACREKLTFAIKASGNVSSVTVNFFASTIRDG